jgi:hypothetical protein
MVLVVGFGGSSSSDSEDTNSASVEASASKAPVEVIPTEDPNMSNYGLYPQAQADFIALIEQAREDLDNAETDLQESVILRDRDKALCGVYLAELQTSGLVKLKMLAQMARERPTLKLRSLTMFELKPGITRYLTFQITL